MTRRKSVPVFFLRGWTGMVDTATVCECFARDGLQHEPGFVDTDRKVELIDAFTALGFRRIEATSYANPKIVPAFADGSDVLAKISRRPGVFYKATCPNVRAVERAVADDLSGSGPNEISLLASATEAHSQRNLRSSRAQQWDNIAAMAAASGGRFRLVGTVSVAFGCPFEGAVDPAIVLGDVERFAMLGVRHIALGDTTGLATPQAVKSIFGKVIAQFPGIVPIAHFHNTRGTGLVNCLAALEAGVAMFDSAFGGIGGHPTQVHYGGGFTGNVATEDLVNLLETMGVRTNLDLGRLLTVAHRCEEILGRTLHSMVARAGLGHVV
jgi:hydroxymethylglutaryl-CoA lyase